jgi:hypothetical protein
MGNIVSAGIFEYDVDFGGGVLNGQHRFDIFLAKHDTDGNHIYSYQFAGSAYDVGRSVAVDPFGNVILGGDFAGYGLNFGGDSFNSGSGYNIYIAKFAPDVPPGPAVRLDIKPNSCPNPLNVQLFEFAEDGIPAKGGVLPVAVLGTVDFDVYDIDVSTLLLEGVPPIMQGGGPRVEDVATPSPNTDECACTKFGPDGLDDLTMKFSAQHVISALSPGTPGETRTLTMMGTLVDGTQFEAQDCVVFVGPKPVREFASGSSVVLSPAEPNPFNPVTRIRFYLPEDSHTRLLIYNVKGELVAKLVDGLVTAGEHTVTWKATGAPSGLYFYRMESGEFRETRKMILLK